MSGFERYIRERTMAYGRPGASISKAGFLSFNSAAQDEFIKDHTHAELYYDRETKLIGIKLFGERRPGGYMLQRRRDRPSVIALMGFLRHYDIVHDKTAAYAAGWDEKNKMVVLDLKARK